MKTLTLNKAISKLLKGRTFAPAIEGTPFWTIDFSTKVEVELKAYESRAGNIYFKLNSSKKDEQQYVGLGALHEDLQSFSDGDVITATVVIRQPNPDITQDELDSCVEAYGESSIKAYKESLENGYEDILLQTYEE